MQTATQKPRGASIRDKDGAGTGVTFINGTGLRGAPVVTDDVQAFVEQMRLDPVLMIESTVRNNPAAVKANWLALTGQSDSAANITATLTRMWRSGEERAVNNIIAVPFLRGKSDKVDHAFAYLRGEVAEMLNDPSNRAVQGIMRGNLKSGPWTPDVDITAEAGPGGSDTTGGGGGSDTWNTILNTLPGLLSIFVSGQQQPSSPTDTGDANAPFTPPPASKGLPLWVKVIGGLALLGLVGWGIAVLIRKAT